MSTVAGRSTCRPPMRSGAFTSSAIHVAIVPGVAISLAVLGGNLLGDALRDALDPPGGLT